MSLQPLMKVFMLLLVMGFGIQAAEAKRFGSGSSLGMQKQMAPKQFGNKKEASSAPSRSPTAAPASAAAAAQGAKQSGASKWLGPLAGLAAGGLLAAMLFGDGFEDFAMMDFLMIALIALLVFFVFKKMRAAKAQNHQALAGAHNANGASGYDSAYRSQAEPVVESDNRMQPRESNQTVEAYDPSAGGSLIGSGVSDDALVVNDKPSWFDEAGFVEQAKTHFVAVQKAWDASDAEEIRSYCTPELFAAIGAEMAGMKPGENYTEVDSLETETAAMAIDGNYFVVSVRFSGFIKEGRDQDAHAFSEIWHIRRLVSDSGDWQIAGIQQEQ